MGLWRKGAKKFKVSVIDRKEKGIQVHFPRPLYEFLGKPSDITFVIEGKKVIVRKD